MSTTTDEVVSTKGVERSPTPRVPASGKAERRAAWGMIAPALVLLTLFLVVPAVLALVLSFTNARLISPNSPEFIGFANYSRAFTNDSTFIRSLLNTFGFALVVVPVQAGLGLLLALLVNQKVRGVNVFRTIFFLPVVTSMVVVSIVWTFMYQETGLINSMLDRVTFGAWNAVAWLQDPNTAMPAIIILSVWQGVGFHMVIWLAGLQTIPAELYEAASLDGATPWQRFAHVTWPGLRATFVFVLVTITIAAFGLFVQVDVMTRGGPLEATTSIIFHAVRKGFREQEVGYGSALSLIFFVLVLIVSLVQRRLTRREA
jgi:multiple sugar transport system permease protein/raffinose/stachyose/melibiose transport system permease protein